MTSAPKPPTVARNVLWNLAGYLMPMAVALLAVPVLLKFLGAERLGILLMAWAVLGYMMLCNLGLNRSLTKALAEGMTHDLPAKLATCRLALLLLGVGSGALLALAAYPTANGWLTLPDELRRETEWLFYMLALSLPVLMLTKHHRGILEGLGRFDLVNRVQLGNSTMNYLGPVLMLPFSRSLAWMGAIILANRVVGLWVLSRYSRRELPSLARPAQATWGEFRQLLGPGAWMTLSSLVLPLLAVVDRMLIGRWCSAQAVAHYATPYEMVIKLWLITSSLLLVMFPRFANAYARQAGELPLLYWRTQRVLLAALFPAVCAFLLLAEDLLCLWVGADFAAAGSNVLRCMAIGMLFHAVSATSVTYLQSINRSRLPAQSSLLSLMIYVPVAWLAAMHLGIVGLAMTWTLRLAVEAVYLVWQVNTSLVEPQANPWKIKAGDLLVPMGCGAMCWVLGQSNVGLWALWCGGGLGLACVGWLLFRWLQAADRVWLTHAWQRLIHHKPPAKPRHPLSPHVAFSAGAPAKLRHELCANPNHP